MNNSNLPGLNKHSPETLLIKEGLIIRSSENGTWGGYEIDRSVPGKFIFRNNSITSSNASGYMLQAGDEAPGPYNNNQEGEIITGNKFVWNGGDVNSITHGVFTGYNLNVLISYNYLLKTPMGLIRKSNGMTNTSGGIAYNIVNNPLKVAVAVKGMNNVSIFNNTFYSERTMSETWRPLVHIYSNDNPVAASGGTKIYDNIFYTKHRIYNIAIDKNCLKDFECDYNIYWCEDGEPMFMVGQDDITFSKWRALGYDVHSRVINPKFKNNIDFVPSSGLNYGKDLGSKWKTGLSVKAHWGKSAPETTEQNGSAWQVGARIYPTVKGKVFYVATTGNDLNPGTKTRPFATWQKGFSSANPGDTVFIRGGVYYPAATTVNIFGSDFYCGVSINNKDGKQGSTINVKAYPGEKPVLDCGKIPNFGYRAGIVLIDCSYWYLKGLEVAGANQVPGFGAFGIYLNSCNYNTLEQIVSRDHGGSGIRIGYESEGNLLLNCDAFNCYDLYTVTKGIPYHGGNADGIEISDIFERDGNERKNILRGCRVWHNSDDGYDFFKCEGIVILDHCWAWNNGYDQGDGSGFKLGDTKGTPETCSQRILVNCLSFSNKRIGFDQNCANVKMGLFSCVAFGNGTNGYNFQWFNVRDTLRNNISFSNGKRDKLQSNQVRDHNSWDIGVTLSGKDFESLSSEGMAGPRQGDGKLPETRFLNLSPRSRLIGAGINIPVQSDYDTHPLKVKPDIGAFQTNFNNP